MKVMVLAGGPDRERAISEMSGQAVAEALQQAGHETLVRDINLNDDSALAEFADWSGDCIFPALHGGWGEGGGVQQLLETRGFAYVGSTPRVAELCMDKHRCKLALADREVPTPHWELITPGSKPTLDPPVVVKPLDEGSSIDLSICRTKRDRDKAVRELKHNYARVMVEQFVTGRELTVGIIGREPGEAGYEALPVIQIVPAAEFYDYEAKYFRDDTQYRFDTDVPDDVLAQVQQLAVRCHSELAVRHLSRVDFILDADHQPWFLEINTMPGFTTHSLLPMAARRTGLEMPALVDRLVCLAVQSGEACKPCEEK